MRSILVAFFVLCALPMAARAEVAPALFTAAELGFLRAELGKIADETRLGSSTPRWVDNQIRALQAERLGRLDEAKVWESFADAFSAFAVAKVECDPLRAELARGTPGAPIPTELVGRMRVCAWLVGEFANAAMNAHLAAVRWGVGSAARDLPLCGLALPCWRRVTARLEAVVRGAAVMLSAAEVFSAAVTVTAIGRATY